MYKISWPNRITITRILLIGPFVMALLHLQDPGWGETARRAVIVIFTRITNVNVQSEFMWGESARWAAIVVFTLMAISDWLDGYLARRLNKESAVGRFLDPLADKLLVLCSVLLLAHEGTHVTGTLLPPAVAVIAIWKDLVVIVGFLVVYFITSQVYINPQVLGKWCTTVQLLMVMAVLLAPDLPAPLARLPAVLWWAASFLAAAAVVQYFRIGMDFISRYEDELEAAGNGKSQAQ